MVGIDAANLDLPGNAAFPAHRELLRRDIVVLENLCNLGKVGRPRFTLIALPLNLRGTTGSPVRAVALLD
jgi:kynurenine formamidase